MRINIPASTPSQASQSSPDPLSGPQSEQTTRIHIAAKPAPQTPQFPPEPPPGAQAEPTIVMPPTTKPKKARRWPLIVGGVLLVLLLGALGGYLGYRSAIAERLQAENDQITKVATEQFVRGVQAQAAGNHALALRHFDYVIKIDPNFPGVKEKLAESMMAIALSRTPTLTPIVTVILPTPTIAMTPTPDLRGEEEVFNNAKALLANKEWSKALEVLDTLRNKNLQYRPVEVDGMYYVALRHQGILSINQGRLETGLYLLALTERFAPLDVDANGLRTWARMYLTGASYWGVRWDKVVEIFGEIYPYYPNLRDVLGVTAAERYRLGAIQYGDQFVSQEKHCDAYDQYKNASQVAKDAALENKMNEAFKICYPPTATATATGTITPTPSPTQGAVQPTATLGGPTRTPTNTHTPGTPSSTPVDPPATPTPTPTTEAPAPTETPTPEAPTPTPTPTPQ